MQGRYVSLALWAFFFILTMIMVFKTIQVLPFPLIFPAVLKKQ
jgi:hypothetical protein